MRRKLCFVVPLLLSVADAVLYWDSGNEGGKRISKWSNDSSYVGNNTDIKTTC